MPQILFQVFVALSFVTNYNNFLISSTDNTLPDATTFPSTTKPGVRKILNDAIKHFPNDLKISFERNPKGT